jgi:biopolymer transport protein ExbB/TolQ
MVQSVAGWFNAGGPFMWVILGVLAGACAVALERAVFYYLLCGENGLKRVAEVAQALNNNNTAEAKKIVAKGNSPLMVLLRTAIERYSADLPFSEIQEGVEETAIQQIHRFSQRLNYLSLFANIATLLGLLGTISGLQLSFSSLASVEAAKKAAMLASGISRAMNTTAFGLIVAVPCMVLYTFLSNKQVQLTKNLDEATVKMLNYLRKKRPQ